MASRKKRPAEGATWLITYADFMTMLLCFFVFLGTSGALTPNLVKAVEKPPATAPATVTPQTVTAAAEPAPQTVVIPDEPAPLGKPDIPPPSPTPDRLKSMADRIKAGMPQGAEVSVVDGSVKITLPDDILFDPSSAALSDGAKTVLTSLAKSLADDGGSQINIGGHADDLPVNSKLYKSNWELSCARACAVAEFLADNGVDPLRLTPQGFGDYRPKADNSTPEGRERNRRVEITAIYQ